MLETYLLEILDVGEGVNFTQKDYLIELQEINKIMVNDPKKLTSKDKKRFWQIIGIIKREISPNTQFFSMEE